ncbi:MAG: hypothetical protein QM680_01780 [Luteolibacter sp.]
MNALSSAPIVFIHRGKSWFLPYALYQARHSNPTRPVFLLGDGNAPEGIPAVDSQSLESDLSQKFRSVFKPMSPNPPEFELMCYLRWFYLLKFLEQHDLEEAFYFDSDVLVYDDCEKVRQAVLSQNLQCGLSIPEQSFDSYTWTACGHASYWRISILRDFCEFCVRSYTDESYLELYGQKIRWQKSQGIRGGICDMTTLYLFWVERSGEIANLARISGNMVVDHNVVCSGNSIPDEYSHEHGIKRIIFEEGMPYFTTQADRKPVLAHSIHFQGARKKLMPRYYTGGDFPGKFSNELRMNLRSAPKRFGKWIKHSLTKNG